MGKFNLYTSEEDQIILDELKVCAEVRNKSPSALVHKAIKIYIESLEGKVQLLADMDEWDKFIKKATPRELHTMNTLICAINNKITKKAWK